MKGKNKHFLKCVARGVISELRSVIKRSPFRLYSANRLVINETNTDGWSIRIGTISRQKCGLEIWLDNYTGYRKRRFWYGFYSNRQSSIKYIARYALDDLGKPKLTIKEKDAAEIGNKVRLRSRLDRTVFGSPVLEYYDDEFYYGVYDYGENLTYTVGKEALIEKIADFFETVSSNLPGAPTSNIDREHYPALENRKIIVTHLRRERKSYLATLRKQLDDFKCQICGMRFEDVYGHIGNRYAEAHHLIPLSKLARAVSRKVDDLITVCANCHRMLHQLEGKPSDVKFLKRRISHH